MDKNTLLRNTAKTLLESVGPANMTQAKLCDVCGVAPGSFKHFTGQTWAEFFADITDGIELADMGSAKRTTPAVRSAQILRCALDLATEGHYRDLTRSAIAERAGVAKGLISYHLKDMDSVREKVMELAIRDEILPVIAQGLAIHDPVAQSASATLKRKAVDTLI